MRVCRALAVVLLFLLRSVSIFLLIAYNRQNQNWFLKAYGYTPPYLVSLGLLCSTCAEGGCACIALCRLELWPWDGGGAVRCEGVLTPGLRCSSICSGGRHVGACLTAETATQAPVICWLFRQESRLINCAPDRRSKHQCALEHETLCQAYARFRFTGLLQASASSGKTTA